MPYKKGPWPEGLLVQPDINSPDVLRRFAASVTDDGLFVFDTPAERELTEAWSAGNAADTAWRVRHGLPVGAPR